MVKPTSVSTNWCDSSANGKVRIGRRAIAFSPEEFFGGFLFMGQFWNYFSVAMTMAFLVALLKVYSRFQPNREFNWVRFVARVGVFAAISTILYVVPIFQISLPFVPSFMNLHFDEVPAMIAGYAYGPIVGEAVLLVKTFIKLPMTSTMCVGEIADFIFSSFYVLPAAWIYKKMRNMKGVFIGFGFSTVVQILVAMSLNVYWILPFYMNVMGFPANELLQLCQKAVPFITDLGWSYAFFGVMPLNIIKDISVFFITFLVYRTIRKALHWEKAASK